MSYKFNDKGEIKREFISNYLFVDGRYDRMSKYGTKPFNNEINWEDLNHFEEEINDYERWFNQLIINDKVENHGIIHIDNNCYCSNCILSEMLLKDYSINNPNLITMDNKHYIILGNKKYPLTKYFKSFY